MKQFKLKKGLDVPISGEPKLTIRPAHKVTTVALLGDDYVGMKPTMEVNEGDTVKTGQLLFWDKKNEGVKFTAPATGKIKAINRGAKRKFESIVIDLEEDDHIQFVEPDKDLASLNSEDIRKILIESGLWNSFRTRPYGKTPEVSSAPAALFVTAMDTRPLAADAPFVIDESVDAFSKGLEVLTRLITGKIFLCVADATRLKMQIPEPIETVEFIGPHPAGLASTHIHFLDQARESRIIWHIDYSDVIAIGHLFKTGHLQTEKILALSGPGVKNPQLVQIRIGGDIDEICAGEILSTPTRLLSGSILDGREVKGFHHFVGRYHNQLSAIHEGSGRALFSWANPGGDRFSIKPVFTSALNRARKFAMNTALWGGERAIYPIDSYAKVMPLDIIPLALLKSLAVGDTEKARSLGALELIEEDLALCSFVCPGKNDFGPMLRKVLTEIELEG